MRVWEPVRAARVREGDVIRKGPQDPPLRITEAEVLSTRPKHRRHGGTTGYVAGEQVRLSTAERELTCAPDTLWWKLVP